MATLEISVKERQFPEIMREIRNFSKALVPELLFAGNDFVLDSAARR